MFPAKAVSTSPQQKASGIAGEQKAPMAVTIKIINMKDRKQENPGRQSDNQSSPLSSPERRAGNPQAEGSASSADNDMDRLTNQQHNLEPDAEEAQSDGNLSFPEGK
jgi:hypothetical protein